MSKKNEYTIGQGKSYWKKNARLISNLPICSGNFHPSYKFKKISFPSWAKKIGVGPKNEIYVDIGYVQFDPDREEWECVDWFSYAFYLMNGVYERKIETEQGPIHSYSKKVNRFPQELWDYAWVNRIFMFLRQWAAKLENKNEAELFGPIPKPKIIMTHDVDALQKTAAIRIKQTAFHVFNALKFLIKGNFKGFPKLCHAAEFFIKTPHYMKSFEEMLNIENDLSIQSLFMFYGGKNNSFKKWLFDPNYDLGNSKYKNLIQKIKKGKWQIGLHQSFDAWQKYESMMDEKIRIEKAFGKNIISCRQHWLRFSWEKTWEAQERSGFIEDYTLGFNDKIGFRNSAALPFNPWDFKSKQALKIISIPMVLMDSHLFDYNNFSFQQRFDKIEKLISEVKFVGGTVSVIWHPHTISADYGWKEEYINLLQKIKKNEVFYNWI